MYVYIYIAFLVWVRHTGSHALASILDDYVTLIIFPFHQVITCGISTLKLVDIGSVDRPPMTWNLARQAHSLVKRKP